MTSSDKCLKSWLPVALLLTTSITSFAYEAPFAVKAPVIDAVADEPIWQQGKWYQIDQLILGPPPSHEDFSGRFKLAWTKEHLYLLVEIKDDILFDQYADPLTSYWDDDCLEIFIDEDHSGGEHQFNFNAFAYHIALDNQAVDIGPNYQDGQTQVLLLNQHVESRWQRQGTADNRIVWEVSLEVHDASFSVSGASNSRVSLTDGKTMGFMLAYCDNDGSKEREHFIGSQSIEAVNGDKNLGYKNADVFGELKLLKAVR